MHVVNANANRELSNHTVQPIGRFTIYLPPKRCLTVTDWTQMAGDRLDVTVNGATYMLTEGVNFTAQNSNAQTATNIASAINALNFGSLPRVRARAEGERVIVAGGATTTTLTFGLGLIQGIAELIDPAPATR